MLPGIHGFHRFRRHRNSLFINATVYNLLHLWAILDVILAAPIKNFRHGVVDDGGMARKQVMPIEVIAKLPCKENEYYDGVVQKCSLCSDVCYMKMVDSSFCANNCPDYFRNNFMKESSLQSSPPYVSRYGPSTVFGHVVFSSSGHIILSPVSTTSGSSVDLERFIDQPLFWTSIISLCISICSTVVIIVLCVRRAHLIMEMRRRRRQALMRRVCLTAQGNYLQDGDGPLEDSKKEINDSEGDAGGMSNNNLKFNQLSHKTQNDGNFSRKLDTVYLINKLESGKKMSPVPLQGEEQGTGKSMPSHPVLSVVNYVPSSLVDKTPAHGRDQTRHEHQWTSIVTDLNNLEHSIVDENSVGLIPDSVPQRGNKSSLSNKTQLDLNTAQSLSRVSDSSDSAVALHDLSFTTQSSTNPSIITANHLSDLVSSHDNSLIEPQYSGIKPVNIDTDLSPQHGEEYPMEILSKLQGLTAVRPSTESALTSALVTAWSSLKWN